MGLSRSAKIVTLLVIDTTFFLVELIAGYAVGSLALVADSFHMLNDVMSLIVALYAIKLTKNSVASARYSYGWHRAEILAALINGVFLLALCFSIFIEAIERFFSVPEVGNPRLVVIVGSFGLLSNIFGLFLFHEHGHSHPESSSPPSAKATPERAGTPSLDETTPLIPPTHPVGTPASVGNRRAAQSPPLHRRSESLSKMDSSRRRSDSNASLSIHPAQVRASLVQVAEDMRTEYDADITEPGAAATSPRKQRVGNWSRFGGGVVEEEPYSRAEEGRTADTRSHEHLNDGGLRNDVAAESHDDEGAPLYSDRHHTHDEGVGPAKKEGGHHGHGSMNMRAVLLHVMGDALGNIGVIATGLIIWLTTWKYRYYCDPAISLVITMIIFSSAMPLVRSASFILLQGVPTTVSLDDVHAAIMRIPGVLSVHELHIWQLSETKIVASVHVLVKKSRRRTKGQEEAKADDGEDESVYMGVASDIRRVLHDFGIHSSTIQPEYVVDDEAYSVRSGCLIPCMTDAECDPANACCPPAPIALTPRSVE